MNAMHKLISGAAGAVLRKPMASNTMTTNIGDAALRVVSTIAPGTLTRYLSTAVTRPPISPNSAAASHDQKQMMEEKCYLVDENDVVQGTASKEVCHRVQTDGTIPLHRAFSVFLFNTKGDLLLQKRASAKITYPGYYTNSCCSHPIADVPGEDEEADAIGIKRAAVRRLNFELGIPVDSIPMKDIHYLTRIHYMDKGNGQWGEHEIDYVLFLKADLKIKPNPMEISEISFVPRDSLDSHLPTLEGPLTPWFQLILQSRLRLWWDNLDNLDQFKDHKTILQFKS